MKRQFTLPIVIAAVLHAGLLLGLRGHPTEMPATTSKRPPVAKSDPPKIEVTLPPETEAEVVAPAKGTSTEAPPTLDENLTPPRPGGISIDIPKHEPTSRGDITIIRPGPVGVPQGEPSELGVERSTMSIHDLDGVPRARYQSQPVYPPEARNAGLAGEVLVEFLVDEAGNVREPRVIRSSDRVFEESALRAVAHWRFEPGRRHGGVVRFRMAVPIVFTLADN